MFALLIVFLFTTHLVHSKPHILLMVLDDIGRSDTSLYGASPSIPLPTLERWSTREGVVLDNFYTQTVCSPTRTALLTGRFPFRVGLQHVQTILPASRAGIPLDVKLLPKLLKEFAGYDTHMIGKWHLGYATKKHWPHRRGFETFYGYMQGQMDYFRKTVGVTFKAGSREDTIEGFDFWENGRAAFETVGNYSVDLYRNRLVEVVNRYAGKRNSEGLREQHPLFLYMAHQTVHIPIESRLQGGLGVDPRCSKINQKIGVRKLYCSMLVELDDVLAETEAVYRKNQMWDTTLVFVMTDNGGMTNWQHDKIDNNPKFPASAGSNAPMRGSKATIFEGGVHAMAFVTGGFVPQSARGSHFKGLAHAVDFFASVLTSAGVLPLYRELLKVDGVNLLHSMFEKSATSLRDHVPINIINSGKSYCAVRFGKYKVIVNDNMIPAAQGWFDRNGDLSEAAPVEQAGKTLLFDLDADPNERNDIAAKNPDLVKRGVDLIQSYVVGGDFKEPQANFRIYLRALPAFSKGGAWRPFMGARKWTELYEKQYGLWEEKDNLSTEEDDEIGELGEVDEIGDELDEFDEIADLSSGANGQVVMS